MDDVQVPIIRIGHAGPSEWSAMEEDAVILFKCVLAALVSEMRVFCTAFPRQRLCEGRTAARSALFDNFGGVPAANVCGLGCCGEGAGGAVRPKQGSIAGTSAVVHDSSGDRHTCQRDVTSRG